MSQPNSLERQFQSENMLRDVGSKPNWDARGSYERLEHLKHCVENGLPAPPDDTICPEETKPQMLAAIEGLMKMCKGQFR
jgi:hypothetical protein